MDEAKIARKDNVQSNSAEVDLKEYIKEDKFSLRLNAETDELLASDHEIHVYSVLFVDSKVLGQ